MDLRGSVLMGTYLSGSDLSGAILDESGSPGQTSDKLYSGALVASGPALAMLNWTCRSTRRRTDRCITRKRRIPAWSRFHWSGGGCLPWNAAATRACRAGRLEPSDTINNTFQPGAPRTGWFYGLIIPRDSARKREISFINKCRGCGHLFDDRRVVPEHPYALWSRFAIGCGPSTTKHPLSIPGDADAEKEQIIRAIYRQVLGNACDGQRATGRSRVPVQAWRNQRAGICPPPRQAISIAAVLTLLPVSLYRIGFPPSSWSCPG